MFAGESRQVTLTSCKTVGGRTVSRKKGTDKRSSLFTEAYERFKSRRQTVKLDGAECYNQLLATSMFQYFREDLGGISTVRLAEDTAVVAVGFYSGELKVCKPHIVDTMAESQTVFRGWEGNYAVSCVKFHPQQTHMLYTASHAGTIYCRDITDNNVKHCDLVITENNNEINSFDFGLKGDSIITGGKDAIIRVYDTSTKQMILEHKRSHWLKAIKGSTESYDRKFHEKRVYCVKSHPEDPNLFITGGWDKAVKVWDVRAKEGCIQNIEGPYIYGECLDINRGRLLTASCVARNSLQLWDLSSGLMIKDLTPSNKRVYLYGEFPYTAQFYRGDASGDLILAGGSGLGGLQVISISNSSIVYLFEDEKPVTAVDSSCDGKVTFGGKSSSLVVATLFTLGETKEPSNQSVESLDELKNLKLSSHSSQADHEASQSEEPDRK